VIEATAAGTVLLWFPLPFRLFSLDHGPNAIQSSADWRALLPRTVPLGPYFSATAVIHWWPQMHAHTLVQSKNNFKATLCLRGK
jgi:hypothetical protein